MVFQRILVAVERSPLSEFVFAQALELAQLNRASLRLLHCLTHEVAGESTTPMSMPIGTYPEAMNFNYPTQHLLIEERIEEAKDLLKRHSEEAKNQGVPITADYKVGEAGVVLCEVAQQWGADLIVVGRRGRTGLAEAVLGSVSNHVMHHAPCSVLVIQEVEKEAPVNAPSDLSSVVVNPSHPQTEG
jgi:nucleotide-binding universal stress UspA family protein